MSKIEEITNELTLRAQQAIPNPSIGKVTALPEKSLQRRMDRFYLDATELKARGGFGIISWARVILGFRERMIGSGYPSSVVLPLIRSILFLSAPPRDVSARATEITSPRVDVHASPEKETKNNALVARARDLRDKGKKQQAMALCNTILARNPFHFDALHLLGTLQVGAGDQETAIDLFGRAIAVNPESAMIHTNLGSAFAQLGEWQRAKDCYERALAIDPAFALAFRNRAAYFMAMEQYEAALADFDVAIRLEPGQADFHLRRAGALRELLRTDEALVEMNKALSLQPNMLEAEWDKSLLLLLTGHFEDGWALFERRHEYLKWKLDEHVTAAREWTGEDDLGGKTIVIVGEQGFGDIIQFSRYAKLVVARGAIVTLSVEPALVAVLRTLSDEVHVIPYGTPTKSDYWCAVGSLPRIFHTTEVDVPSRSAYLYAQKAQLEKWTRRLGPQHKPRVGLIWSGNPRHGRDQLRSIPFEKFERHLPDGFEYISLQRDVRSSDAQSLRSSPRIKHFGAELSDFADTAALCKLMDLVISVDSGAAHLSAAVGCPTWILVTRLPDWRWMLDSVSSYWYESVKLFRQGSDHDWEPVLNRVAAELKNSSFASLNRQDVALAATTDMQVDT